MNTPSLFPEEFLGMLERLVPDDRLENVLRSFSKLMPLSLRVNRLKSTAQEVAEILTHEGLSYTVCPWNNDAFILPETASRQLTSLESYTEGKFYIQSLSSMIPPLVLDPKPEESILDIAAAPGSKTTQIAGMMHNSGTIVANDISRQRVFKLRSNLKQQGVSNTTILTMPGEAVWKRHMEFFDKTLVDAPCSMEGRFNTTDTDSYKDWSPRKIKELSHRQQYLLRAAVTATKVGGLIVYSTCTISPEENEGVIDWLLEKEDSLVLEEIHIPHLKVEPGITQWKNKTYSEELTKTARVYPSADMEGFFIAKIRKTRSTLTPELFMPRKR